MGTILLLGDSSGCWCVPGTGGATLQVSEKQECVFPVTIAATTRNFLGICYVNVYNAGAVSRFSEEQSRLSVRDAVREYEQTVLVLRQLRRYSSMSGQFVNNRVTLFDIADALGVSTGTVHRALHDHPGVSPMTKTKVLQMAKNLGYRPNLAARYLSSKKNPRISVITLQGTTSFWDEVRAGIGEEARASLLENVELEFRTYPRLGEGDEEAFGSALDAKVDGIIVFPSRPQKLRSWIRRA